MSGRLELGYLGTFGLVFLLLLFFGLSFFYSCTIAFATAGMVGIVLEELSEAPQNTFDIR